MSKNNRKNLILGGGISGLIWKFYHPEYEIITPEVGGVFAKTMMVWLHDTLETRKLLTDLGWKDPEKYSRKAYIGYHYKGWITETLTKEMSRSMIQKKMTDWSKPVDQTFTPDSFDFSTTTDKTVNYLNHLDVDLSEVVNKLSTTTITGFVSKITDKSIEYQTTPGKLISTEYDNLISTIAAPIFWKIYGQEKAFNYLPITNVIVKRRPECFNDKFAMVYYDENFTFCRISHIKNVYALEFTGELNLPEAERLCGQYDIQDIIPVKFGRIFEKKEENKPPQNNIQFLGRFAEWKYGITSEHVLSKTLYGK